MCSLLALESQNLSNLLPSRMKSHKNVAGKFTFDVLVDITTHSTVVSKCLIASSAWLPLESFDLHCSIWKHHEGRDCQF